MVAPYPSLPPNLKEGDSTVSIQQESPAGIGHPGDSVLATWLVWLLSIARL